MADPISGAMLAVGIGSSIAGGVTSAIGSSFKGKAESNMYQYQAGVAQINKEIALQNADYARYVGEVQAQKSGMATRTRLGQIKVAQGASNLDVNTGSGAAVRESQQDIGRQDQNIIRANAARQAYGYEVEAAGAEASKGAYQMSAENARIAGNLGAVSSLISAAGSVSSKWFGAQSVFGSPSMTPSAAYHNSGGAFDY